VEIQGTKDVSLIMRSSKEGTKLPAAGGTPPYKGISTRLCHDVRQRVQEGAMILECSHSKSGWPSQHFFFLRFANGGAKSGCAGSWGTVKIRVLVRFLHRRGG